MKKIPVLWILTAAFFCGCAQKNAPRARVAPDAEKTAIEKGVRFLIDTQNRCGSWGLPDLARPGEGYYGTVAAFKAYEGASTALCLMALMDAKDLGMDVDAPLRRGANWLLALEPTRRSDGAEFYCVWSLAYCVQGLARCARRDDLDPPRDAFLRRIRDWVRYMEKYRSDLGGWGYYDFEFGAQRPHGSLTTCFTTATMLIALKEAREAGAEIPEDLFTRGIKVIRDLRTPDKTYLYGYYMTFFPGSRANRPKGTLGRAQPCNVVLHDFNAGVSVEDVRLGLDRLFDHHHFMDIGRGRPNPHESWYATSGYYFFYGHFYAVDAIQRLPAAERAPYWEKLSRAMLDSQQADGSWWDFPLSGYYKSYGTGFALCALIACHRSRALTPAPGVSGQ